MRPITKGAGAETSSLDHYLRFGFCYTFYQRARNKGHIQAIWRAGIYAVCGITIVVVIVVLAIDSVLDGSIRERIPRLTFYGEFAGLVAFGVAWLIASRVLPIISSKKERFSVFD